MKLRPTGGGRYDPDEGFIFFVAGVNIDNSARYHPWTLMAVNTLMSDGGIEELESRLRPRAARMLMDSGVFMLGVEHGKKRGMTFNEVLALPPEQIDGFDALVTRYIDVVRKYEDRLWGYVELDQGGPEGKRRLRSAIEAEGLKPIPVYHPLGDGWDYLDELFDAGYDRICVGNVVMADVETRRAIAATIWERRRRLKRPVWVHFLGYTPNPLFNAYPVNSADSSVHVYSLRFGASMWMGRAMLGQFSTLNDDGYSYDLDNYDDPERGLAKQTAMLAWIARAEVASWRRAHADLTRLLPDLELWPAPLAGEPVPTPGGFT